jgi:uncharacterized membrane protein
MPTAAVVPPPRLRPGVRRLISVVTVVFALLGAASGILRAVFIDDFVARVEPFRQRVYHGLGLVDPDQASRADLVRQVDRRFAENHALTYVHVVFGAGYLVLGLLQFATAIRIRYPVYHRWAGRLLVTAGIVMALPGMYFGVVIPFAGRTESAVIAVVGGLFLISLVRGLVSIRRRQLDAHREWMTRAFALALGITSVRLSAAVLDPVMTMMGFTAETTFAVALWTGWGVTLVCAEWWLRRTRRDRRVVTIATA